MSPPLDIAWVVGAPGRAAAAMHPAATPLMARRTYALELRAGFLFAIALATIEGGVIGVFAKQTFTGIVPEARLNFAVGLLGSMEALANILSFVWSSLGHGKHKVRLINALQTGVIAAIATIAFLPRTPIGLTLLVLVALLARMCWSGVLTIRPTVWRSNYPAALRASIVGRLSIVQVLVIAAVGAGLGRALDAHPEAFRLMIPLACVCGLGAAWATSRIRVRHHARLLKRELAGTVLLAPWKAPMVVWDVLRSDKRYAQYMACMFVLGFGNLMVNPMLAITLREQFGMNYLSSILITSTIQGVAQAAAIPLWARLLDRTHVVRFRAFHAWMFLFSGVVLVLASALHRAELMYVAAALLGFGYAGGSIAWHLGHVDFAAPAQTSRYMAAHVTLNGVRGLLAPLTAVGLYEWLKAAGADAATWVYAASLVVSVAGAVGFTALNWSMGAGAAKVPGGRG